MPAHWLACPVYTNATFVAARGCGLPPASATALSPSRSDTRSLRTTPTRYEKWLLPTPVGQVMSASIASAAPSVASVSERSSSHDRYRPAKSRSASSDFPDSGRNRVPREPNSSSVGRGSATDPGRETTTRRAEPVGPSMTEPGGGAPFGGLDPSTATCALVPDQPNELTPARGGRSASSGQSVRAEVTRKGNRSQSMSGFGFRKCRCFGITPRLIASTALIRPATPAAGSRWPIFVFTEPISSGRSGSRPLPYTAAVAPTSIGSPTFVPVPWVSR